MIMRTSAPSAMSAGRTAPSAQLDYYRRLPVGAEMQPQGGVHFRTWAPKHKQVSIRWSQDPADFDKFSVLKELKPEKNGYFSGYIADAKAGAAYKVQFKKGSFPDPASRLQPLGPHGPSQVVDPAGFKWTDTNWRGVSREGQIIYEMHLGTFTREGTWRAAMEQLPALADLGVTILEIMPIADFPGRFGWGYDGVNLFAPSRLYGSPDDVRAFVDRAHAVGLGVILDVVYNHLGPDGNYFKEFSEDYFSRRYKCEWGEALNFDGENSGPVREFFISNAGYWIDEFHFDGLRLDATQQIFDESKPNVMAEITRAVREYGRSRGTYIVAENEPQHTNLVRENEIGGFGMDALWNDDFHHSAMVALTGHAEAYYSDYKGLPQEFISAAKWGYLYQGQRYKWQEQRRGTPGLDLEPTQFVHFLQNHDQVANSLRGQRLHEITSRGELRAMTALLLLGPQTPMLFQGQEFAASTPFLYFADHNPDLASLVAAGRKEFLTQFPTAACPESKSLLTSPEAENTFVRCKLDFSERERHAEIYRLHRDLLKLRREDRVLSRPRRGAVDGSVLASHCFLLRFFGIGNDDRLLIINLGTDLHLDPAPEPLLAPVEGHLWRVKWSSEDPCYGGNGTPSLDTEENWKIPGRSAVLLEPDFCPEELAQRAGSGPLRRTA
jgi:maltooligosyltrehalose trehalohydrolase